MSKPIHCPQHMCLSSFIGLFKESVNKGELQVFNNDIMSVLFPCLNDTLQRLNSGEISAALQDDIKWLQAYHDTDTSCHHNDYDNSLSSDVTYTASINGKDSYDEDDVNEDRSNGVEVPINYSDFHASFNKVGCDLE